jgi:hypothetical protein
MSLFWEQARQVAADFEKKRRPKRTKKKTKPPHTPALWTLRSLTE